MAQRQGEYRKFNDILNGIGKRFYSKVCIESIEDGRNITYGQFTEECNRLAHFLNVQKIKANERIVIVSPNSIEWLIIFFGVMNYGATIVPLFEEYPDNELRNLLNRIRPRFIFRSTELSKPLPGGCPGEVMPFARRDCPDGEEGELFSLLKKLPTGPLAGSVAAKEDIAVINATSGTMEEPRCVLRNYESFFCQAPGIIERWGLNEEQVVLEYRSFSWLSAEAQTITPALLSGATLAIARKFSRSRYFYWMDRHKVTISVGVPAVINMLLERPVAVTGKDFPSLRFITSSSASLFAEKQKEFEERYHIPLVQLMGMTEAVWVALNSPEKRKIGSVGRPVDVTAITIRDENGNILRPGKEGDIVIQGKNVGQGYLLEGGAIEDFAPDGCFRTGDIGYLDEDGFLYVTGRRKNLIIRGGLNISPLQVNNVLLKHPCVHEAETIGVPDPLYGEEAICFVTLRPGGKATSEELMAYCAQEFPRQMRPKEIFILGKIPKTARGKINKPGLFKIARRRR